MNILFVSPEVFPFAKTGGLADVIGALPASLNKRGHISSVILPLYKCVRENGFSPKLYKSGIYVKMNGNKETFNLYSLRHGKVEVYFIEKKEYFNRDYLYGTPEGDYPDNVLRFGFLAKAIVTSISLIGKQDILHCNDWQSGLVPLYIRLFYKNRPEFINTKILFTIHNMAYQGLFDRQAMASLGIPEGLFVPDGLEFYNKLSFMKAGIIYSDAISTVSEGYSREILH